MHFGQWDRRDQEGYSEVDFRASSYIQYHNRAPPGRDGSGTAKKISEVPVEGRLGSS